MTTFTVLFRFVRAVHVHWVRLMELNSARPFLSEWDRCVAIRSPIGRLLPCQVAQDPIYQGKGGGKEWEGSLAFLCATPSPFLPTTLIRIVWQREASPLGTGCGVPSTALVFFWSSHRSPPCPGQRAHGHGVSLATGGWGA